MSPAPTLWGVGVGPGAADLLTLRAREVLRAAPVLACPRASDFGESAAFRIARPVLAGVEGQERLFLTFPMSKDPARVAPAVERAVSAICARLLSGVSVAFITEGDPSTFSSFIYVRQGVLARVPDLDVQVVPGVSSITAVPAVAGIPLADGQERVAILPGTYGLEDLGDVLDRFDTVVLMKVGAELPRIIEALAVRDLLSRAVYVSHATGPRQRIVRDLREVAGEHGDCFAMVVVRRGARSGLLLGAAAQARLDQEETR